MGNKKKSDTEEQLETMIVRFQATMPILRKLLLWTAHDVGRRVDLTKQTISNLENGSTMTTGQYFILRSMFERELVNSIATYKKNPEKKPKTLAIKAYNDLINDNTIDETHWEDRFIKWTMAADTWKNAIRKLSKLGYYSFQDVIDDNSEITNLLISPLRQALIIVGVTQNTYELKDIPWKEDFFEIVYNKNK